MSATNVRFVDKRRRSTLSSFKRKSKRISHKRRSTAKTYNEIPGLFQVRMSPSLQSVLSCRIGIDITNTDRWMYIYKETLLKVLKNRQSFRDKEFKKIKKEIKTFPDEYILIGSYGEDEFLICLSEYAKKVCENWKQEEKKILLEKLNQLLSRNALTWNTLGSDREIERITFNRKPFSVQFQLNPNANAKFSLRLVKDVKDGYAEFVNTRTIFNILYRRRLDKASQVSKLQKNNYTQTTAPTWTHRAIQYNFSYPEVKSTKALQLKLNDCLALHYSNLSSHIKYNACINIYKNDYRDLPNQKSRYSIDNPAILTSFHDCISCHAKMVNCIAWNAHISGIVAAGYGRISPRFIRKEPPLYRDGYLKVTDTNLVLIWSVTQPTKPLLYLHAKREITAINFCPYNPNILVGGCVDGQIVVWDVSGKLDAQKIEVPLQRAEVDVLIREKMSWMKYPPDEQNVFPCIESKIETCHKSHITVIKWIPPEYELNNLGEFVKCEENEERMQFLTTAVSDSVMLAWDLKPKNRRSEPKKKKHKHRLSTRPATLDDEKSPFSQLNANFKPVYKLVLIDSATKGPMYTNDISFKMGSFSYLALNPETAKNALQRTYFVRKVDNENIELEKRFLAATDFGQLYRCSWTPFDYDRGLEINEQQIDTVLCKSYHDGPIYHMQRSPFCADLVLTTGGRVFAIWYELGDHFQRPLLWRKSEIRYVMAVWSLQNHASIIAAREDGHIELWDIDEDSKAPLRMIKLVGDQLLSLFVNDSFQHVLKGTCITTDLTGTLSMYCLSSNLFVKNRESRLNISIRRNYQRREQLNYWSDYVRRRWGQIEEPQECDNSEAPEVKRRTVRLTTEIRRVSFEIKPSAENKWQEKEYKRMYNVLIEKHRLNLDTIEKNKGPLNIVLQSHFARLRKIDRYIREKEKIFQEEKIKLTSECDEVKKKSRLSVRFPNELVKLMKEQYYESYKTIETDAKTYIDNHRYRYYFDWQAMILQARERYDGEIGPSYSCHSMRRHSKTQRFMNLIPTHVGRRSTKVLMTEIALVTSISGK